MLQALDNLINGFNHVSVQEPVETGGGEKGSFCYRK